MSEAMEKMKEATDDASTDYLTISCIPKMTELSVLEI